MRIERTIDRLLNQRFCLFTIARLMDILLNRLTLLTINMAVAFSGEDQCGDQTLSPLIDRRRLLAKLRLILMRFTHTLFVFVPQQGARRRAAADNQRVFAIFRQ